MPIPPDLAFAMDVAEFEAQLKQAPRPTTDDELLTAVYDLTGIRIPDKCVCHDAGHASPFQAFADAYFARAPIAVWKASRGFGGKSLLLATLGFMEMTTLGAAVSVLGGSGEQSQNVYEYLNGAHENVPGKFWGWPSAPMYLVKSGLLARQTKLTNYGGIKTLMASQKSVRGPHRQRLRLDEADEMDIAILDAALGQPMEARGIKDQIVISSTHQHADGTMTEILKRAKQKQWPVYEWCWRENTEPHGWLSLAQVERKREVVTAVMWDTEYELQEPNPEGRAIVPEKVEAMFRRDLGLFDGRSGEYIEIEEPQAGGRYATGVDWARDVDWTIIITLRVDVRPIRLAAFRRCGRMPWPRMIAYLDQRIERYGGAAAHDATGLGKVVEDYIKSDVESVMMVGRARSDMLTEYINAIERGDITSPHIEFMYSEHKYASNDHIYGNKHLPDTIAAGALAYWCYNRGGNYMEWLKKRYGN